MTTDQRIGQTYLMQFFAVVALLCSLGLIGWTVERGYWRWFDIGIIAVNGGLMVAQTYIFFWQISIRRWWRLIQRTNFIFDGTVK